jgi:hypothetical protein
LNNLFGTTIVGTSATLTNLAGTTATYTNLFGTTIVGTSANLATLTSTSAIMTTLGGTTGTITNIFGTTIVGTSATLTNLAGTTATYTNLFGTTIVGTSATLTNLTTTTLYTVNAYITDTLCLFTEDNNNVIPASSTTAVCVFGARLPGPVLMYTDEGRAKMIQPSFGRHRIKFMYPAVSTTGTLMNQIGISFTSQGTAAGISIHAGTLAESIPRLRYSATGVTISCGIIGYQQYYRGAIAKTGGFYSSFKFRFNDQGGTYGTSSMTFIGMKSTFTSATVYGTGQSQFIGILLNGSTCINIAAGLTSSATSTYAITALNTNNNFNCNITVPYEFVIYAPPSGTTMGWYLEDMANGFTAAGSFVSTFLPGLSTYLGPHILRMGGITTVTACIEIYGFYSHQDY